MDIGAFTSVVDIKEIRNTCSCLKKKFFASAHKTFLLCRCRLSVFEHYSYSFSASKGVPDIFVKLKVVSVDISAPSGLDVLILHSSTADSVSNIFFKNSACTSAIGKHVMTDEWSVAPATSNGHVLAKNARPDCTLFTALHLSKLHRQFVHPSADNFCDLLKRASLEVTSEAALTTLKNFTQQCDVCQCIWPGPIRFRYSLSIDDLRFNEEIFMDIMYIFHEAVIHIVDPLTKFSNAGFLADSRTSPF